MIRILAAILFIVVLTFGLSSISQSYAAAKQAQVAIEASRAAQTASLGNLATILVIALIVVSFIAMVIFIAYLELRGIPYRKTRHTSNSSPSQEFQQDSNGLLPAMMTLMMYEMLRQQQETQQHIGMELSNPEIPVMPDHTNDFWNM